MTHALLTELKESEADFAAVKTELSILRENVKGLSEIIREGNGASSILTRLALAEQRIISIDKWMENHIDVHQRSKTELGTVKEEVNDINHKLKSIHRDVYVIKNDIDESEKQKKENINRELEIQHHKNKNAQKVKTERQSAIIKVTIAIVLTIISTVSGYLANSCQELHTYAPGTSPSTSQSVKAP
jgi:myosin heavy subunit